MKKNLIFERMFSGKLESSGTIRRKLTWDDDDADIDDDNGDDDDDDDDNDNPDLVLDLLHAGGLHDLLENGSLDRPQLSVSHRLQVSLSSSKLQSKPHHPHQEHACYRDHDHDLHTHLDACCSLAVVENRQLSESLSNSESF